MVKLHQIGSIELRVYGRDHAPPHFHAVGTDFQALIGIDSLDVLAGSMPPRAHRAVMAWAAENRALLAAAWNRLNAYPIA